MIRFLNGQNQLYVGCCIPSSRFEDLINVKACSTRILGVGQSSHQCTAIGDLPIFAKASDGSDRALLLRNVRYVSSFTDSLISVGQLWQDSTVDTVFKDSCHLVLPCGLKFPFTKGKGPGLYIWNVHHGMHGNANQRGSSASSPHPVASARSCLPP